VMVLSGTNSFFWFRLKVAAFFSSSTAFTCMKL
jgi:hypothetical protein